MRLYIFLTFLFIVISVALPAQEDLVYQKPSTPILSLTDYERAPTVLMDTKKNYMLLSYRDVYRSLDDLSQGEMRLAGLRINPLTNISSTVTYLNNIKIRKIKDVKAEPVQVSGLPENPRIAYVSWSPDDSRIAFTHTTARGVELWVVDVETAAARKLTDDNLNANMGSPYSWHKDNKTLLVRMTPANRPA